MYRTPKQMIGDLGETLAARYLKRNGYDIVEKKYKTKYGEIDLIAWHIKKHFGKTLCFIEVKTRSYGIGSAERATGQEKIRRIKRAATSFCVSRSIPFDGIPMQFEHVSVYLDPQTSKASFRVYEIPIA